MTHNSSLPHFDLANHPAPETINMITGLLERITKTNDKLQASNGTADKQYTAFHSRSVPTIGIHAYLSRILKYCPCTNECFLSLLVYFDRMSRNSSCLRITSFNIHRLVISGIMVASKFFSDIFFTNTRYAKVGGLPVAELNALELEFLHLNDYNLNVPIEELQQYGDQLLLHWVREEERRRELQWRRKEVIGDDERMTMVAMRRSLSASTNNSSDSNNSSDNTKTQSSSTITTTTAASPSSSSHNPRTILADEAKKNNQQQQYRRLSYRKEEGAGSDPFCRQSRATKPAHENRATRVTYKSTTANTSVPSRYSTTTTTTTPPGTGYHQFPASQTLDGIPVTTKRISQSHHQQRHSWHIDHHHRLPTPPYSTVIHP